MRHLEEGQLRAYHDDALEGQEREAVRAHLAVCARCARVADAVQERAAHVNTLLASLDPQPAQQPVASQFARARLDRYIEQKKEQAMHLHPATGLPGRRRS
jgi:anti-sigma factor RsiW